VCVWGEPLITDVIVLIGLQTSILCVELHKTITFLIKLCIIQ